MKASKGCFAFILPLQDHRSIRAVSMNKLRGLVWVEPGNGVITERAANL
jgi:hypothetical protein